jgi:tRNA pseudouridine55 synthase
MIDLADRDFEAGEILNINKPEGWTSFDVVKKVRRLLRVKKVGHAGTLDPFATGVLLVCTGRATKRVSKLMGLEKEYVGVVELGKTTDTLDVTGSIVEEREVPAVTLDEVRQVAGEFVGRISQVPPAYSALKVNGRRMYKLARKGEAVALPPRTVEIYAVDVLDLNLPELTIRVRCGKGTYIRALARDIGERLGTVAYLRTLQRTAIGPYRIEDALRIEDLEEAVLAS